MSKQFWVFLIAGLGIAGGVLALLLVGTKSAHLELTGEILKVRVLNLGPQASLVVADFRITNPSGVPFVVSGVEMTLQPAAGETATASVVSKPQVDAVFQGARIIGTKYNDVLSLQDRVAPHQTVDRMVAGRFELPESSIDRRKSLRLKIDDVDGASAEIAEPKK